MKDPFIIDSELITFFDCDDTLVMWDNKYWEPGDGKIELTEPYDAGTVYLRPHKAHISLLKKFKARNYTIIVWSGNGAQWAKEVIKRLELESYVDVIMSKPIKFVDDLPAEEILTSRIYIEEK